MNNEIRPSSIAPPAANYALAVLSRQPTRWLHTSGIVATRLDGTVPESLADQAASVWSNIAVILNDAGMSPADVVSITTYVVVGEPLGPVMTARDGFMGTALAASTLITVPALARPEWRIEIAIIAASS